MLINLSDVFKEQGKVEHVATAIEMTSYNNGIEYQIAEKSEVQWTLTNIEPGRVKIEGKAKLVFAANCDR
ncbi:MAG: DUF177 domain-containing protein, partial [Lachnospiraceae bacterium]|nr:DUF177 domain-containing protein [Lachnospiraceae bacterium]